MSEPVVSREDLVELLFALNGEAESTLASSPKRSHPYIMAAGMSHVAKSLLHYATGLDYVDLRQDARYADPESVINVRQQLDRKIYDARHAARQPTATARLDQYIAENPGLIESIIGEES